MRDRPMSLSISSLMSISCRVSRRMRTSFAIARAYRAATAPHLAATENLEQVELDVAQVVQVVAHPLSPFCGLTICRAADGPAGTVGLVKDLALYGTASFQFDVICGKKMVTVCNMRFSYTIHKDGL